MLKLSQASKSTIAFKNMKLRRLGNAVLDGVLAGSRWATVPGIGKPAWGDLSFNTEHEIIRVGGRPGRWTMTGERQVKCEDYVLTFDPAFRTFTATLADGMRFCTGTRKEVSAPKTQLAQLKTPPRAGNVAPNPVLRATTPAPLSTPRPVAAPPTDPIVGRWQFGGRIWVISADGNMNSSAPGFSENGKWKRVSDAVPPQYEFNWSGGRAIDTLFYSVDQDKITRKTNTGKRETAGERARQ